MNENDIMHRMKKYEPYGHSGLEKRKEMEIHDSNPDLAGLLDN